MPRTYHELKSIRCRPQSRAASLSRRRQPPLRRQLLGRHDLRHRHASAGSDRHVARRQPSPPASSRIATANTCSSPIASRTTSPCSTRRPELKRSGWRPGAAQATSRPHPTAPGFTSRTSIPTPSARHRTAPRIGNHGDRYGARDGHRSHRRSRHRARLSTSPSPPMAGSEWRPACIPRTWCPWRISSTAGHSPTRSLCSAPTSDKPVEIPLDELERYAVRPFGSRSRPTSRGSTSPAAARRWSRSSMFRACSASFTRIPARIATDLSASANYVTARIVSAMIPRGMAFSRAMAASCWSPIASKTRSASSTRAPIASPPRFRSTDQSKCRSCVMASRPSIPRAIRSRDRSAAPTATSIPPSTGCTWDLEPDGFGRDIVDNRPIEDVKDTEPYKWNGGNPNLPTECGPRTEKYFWRVGKLRRSDADGPGGLCAQPAAAAQSLASAGARTDARPGARQGSF